MVETLDAGRDVYLRLVHVVADLPASRLGRWLGDRLGLLLVFGAVVSVSWHRDLRPSSFYCPMCQIHCRGTDLFEIRLLRVRYALMLMTVALRFVFSFSQTRESRMMS